jgi:hypothetical protein
VHRDPDVPVDDGVNAQWRADVRSRDSHLLEFYRTKQQEVLQPIVRFVPSQSCIVRFALF